MCTDISIETDNGRINVSSPYHPDFPKRARALGGRWNGAAKIWSFDVRDEPRVRELCRDVFGTDGEEVGDLVTLRVSCAAYSGEKEIWVAGRQVVRKQYRDSAPRLGEGCVVVSGSFPTRAGSMKYPIIGENDAIVEVRDVPRAAAESQPAADVTIFRCTLDREALEAERERLQARIAEINELLGEEVAS